MTHNKIEFRLMYMLLFLSAFKLFDLQSVITIAFILFLILYLLKYSNARVMVISKQTIILFLFFLFYCSTFFFFYGYNYSILRTAIFAVLLFHIGTMLPFYMNEVEDCYKNFIFAIGGGMATYGSLSFFSSYTGEVLSSMNALDRYVTDFWNGLAVPPTNFNTNFLVLFAIVAYSVFVLTGWKKLVVLILTFMGVLVAFGTATRTNLFMIVLSFLIYFIYQYVYEKRKIVLERRNINKQWLLFGAAILILIFVVFMKWGNQIFLLTAKLFASLQYRTSNYVSFAEDPRWQSWLNAFVGLLDYPLGNNISMHMEAHNIILEAGRRTGIIPFLLLLIFFINIGTTILKFSKQREINSNVRLLCLLVGIGAMLAMMIEPVFLGRPFIFIYFSLVWGMNVGMLKKMRLNV